MLRTPYNSCLSRHVHTLLLLHVHSEGFINYCVDSGKLEQGGGGGGLYIIRVPLGPTEATLHIIINFTFVICNT